MLIKCPECEKEISDKSDRCIHCGYPLKSSTICIINGKECDISFVFDESISRAKRVSIFRQLCKCGLKIAVETIDDIIEKHEIPKALNLPIQEQETNQPESPKCPKCNSTSITAGQRGFSIITGFIGSSKTVNRCANCGYKWKPSR